MFKFSRLGVVLALLSFSAAVSVPAATAGNANVRSSARVADSSHASNSSRANLLRVRNVMSAPAGSPVSFCACGRDDLHTVFHV